MTRINRLQSVEYLDVSVIDRDIDFLTTMIETLEYSGITQLHCGASLKYAEQLVRRPGADIIFLEYNRQYLSVWEYIRTAPSLQAVVVGMTHRRNSRESLSAIHSGAERVIAKNQAHCIVEPMLIHLLDSDLARRFRVVAFPGAS